jgi:tRNA nucleotidyltransferase (CCA-adding enzyme)
MKAYLVGGAVRDTLLKYPVYDKDWVVVGATPKEMQENGFKPVGSDFPVFLHPDTKEEYALARTERKNGKGYNGFDYYAAPDVTLEEDLSRRDLTINAMAMDQDGKLVDPYGGQRDLEQRCLRHVSAAFEEDPLRVLRVARFAARYAHLGFTVASETLELMRKISASDELLHLTKERIWQEMFRALGERSPLVFFQVLNDAGATASLFPRLAPIGDLNREATPDSLFDGFSPTERLAALITAHLKEESHNDIETLCRDLKMPNATREVICLSHRFAHHLLTWSSLDAHDQLSVLQALDAERKQERLTEVINTTRLVNALQSDKGDTEFEQGIDRSLQAIRSVDVQSVIQDGHKGKAIREELIRRQIAALEDTHSSR